MRIFLSFVIALALTSPVTAEVEFKRFNPEGMSQPAGYRHVVTASGGKIVYLAGQAGLNIDGTVPEGGLETQVPLMFEKVRTALTAAGGTPSDVTRIVVYIVGLGQGTNPMPVYQGIRDFFPEDGKPASSIIGISGLAVDGLLVEIDVTAHVAE